MKKETMWNLYLSCITKKFADFKGCATRKEYWSYVLFYTFFSIPITLIIDSGVAAPIDMSWLNAVYFIVFFTPSTAVLVRRMHDAGFSAWWLLTIFVPLIMVFLPSDANNKYTKDESKPLSKNQKIIFGAIIALLCVGVTVSTIDTEANHSQPSNKQANKNLLAEIINYQVQTSTQPKMKEFKVEMFEGEYAPNCPLYAPFIYYALKPNTEFQGISGRQGETLYTFNAGRFVNFGYYDPSVMGNEGSIKPIFYDSSINKEMTQQEMSDYVSKNYCAPINEALSKYGHLPVAEIVANMKNDILNTPSVDDEAGMTDMERKVAQFKRACPECVNVNLIYNGVECPLVLSMATHQCDKVSYKKDSPKRIVAEMEGCPGGDGFVVFSYGKQYAHVEAFSMNGTTITRNPYTADELDASLFSQCWIVATQK